MTNDDDQITEAAASFGVTPEVFIQAREALRTAPAEVRDRVRAGLHDGDTAFIEAWARRGSDAEPLAALTEAQLNDVLYPTMAEARANASKQTSDESELDRFYDHPSSRGRPSD